METILSIDIVDTHKCPKLSLNRELTINDLANVDERCNALIFLLDDDKGWTYEGKKAVLKIRFKLADEMKEKFKQNSDAITQGLAMNLWKVHRFEVKTTEANPDKEDELKAKVVEIINDSIKKLNQKADMSF